MPGLSLTSVQAIKLFGVSPDVCAGILSRLIEDGVLRLKSDGRYAVASRWRKARLVLSRGRDRGLKGPQAAASSRTLRVPPAR